MSTNPVTAGPASSNWPAQIVCTGPYWSSASQPSQDRYAASPAMMMVGRHRPGPEARGLLAGLRGGRIDLGRLSNHAVVSLLLLRRNGGCQISSYDHGRRPAVVQLQGTVG